MKEDQHSRGAFEGMTDDEIEEEYRLNREIMAEHNKLHNRILTEVRIMVNETREDIKRNPIPYYVIGAMLIGIVLGLLL